MRRRIALTGLAAAIAIVMYAAPAAAESQLARLKNLRLGMSMPEVNSPTGDGFEPGDFNCGADSPTTFCSSKPTTVAQIPAQVTLYFVNTAAQPPAPLSFHDRRMMSDEQISEREAAMAKDMKVAAIRVVVDSDEHDALLAALRARNGAPAASSESAYSNAFGAVVSGSKNHWSAGDIGVDLWQRCGRIDESCLYIQSLTLVRKYRAIDEPSTKDRQKDL